MERRTPTTRPDHPCPACGGEDSAPGDDQAVAIDPRDPASWPVVLDPAQIAKILLRPRKEVIRLARAGKIPGAFRSGKYWRFRAPALRRWLDGEER